MNAKLDVGIIGAGTAGAAAALFLARAGHRVTLYERVPEPSAVGSGIMLQPAGMAALARLGLLDEVIERGSRVLHLRSVTSGGRTVLDLDYRVLGDEMFGVGLHRGVLFDALHAAVAGESRVELRCGLEVKTIGAAHDGASLAHARRFGCRTLRGPGGDALGTHDLVIVADGARSHLRGDTSIRASAHAYPWGAFWHIGPDPGSTVTGELYQLVEGPRRMLGLLPCGVGPRGNVPLVSLFFSVCLAEVDAWYARGLGHFKDECLRLSPRVAPFLDAIGSMDDLTVATYHDVVMPTWNTRSVVYLGDAAHATSPQLGQGCNLALVDAMTLADCLASEPHVPTALDAYSRERREHLSFYQQATRLLTPFFQSDYRSLAWLRDTFMGTASQLPFVRSEMVRSMTGTKRSWLLPR